MASAAELAILLKLKDEASKGLDAAGKKAGGLGSKLGALNKVAAAAAVGGVAALGAGLLKTGMDFDKAYDKIAVGTGATGDKLKALKGDFKEVFGRIPTDMEPAAAAIADFNTLTGATGEDLRGLAMRGLEAGRMLGEDTAGLINATGRALNVFGENTEDANARMDEMFIVSQDTGIGMTKLAGNLQTFGPVLKNLGMSMSESTALFGSLHKAGIDVTRVMPGINAFMRKMAKEGVTDLNAALADTAQAIKDAPTDVEALNIATAAFGAEGAQRMAAGIRSGALELEGLQEAMGDTNRGIFETAEATESMGEKFGILKNKILIAVEPLATALFEGLGKLADWMMDVGIPAIKAFGQEWGPKLAPFLKTAMTGLSTILDGAKALGDFLSKNKVLMIAAITAVGAAIVLAFGPISLAIVAIAGLLLAVGYIRDNWDMIQAKTKEVWDAIDAYLGPVIDAITESIMDIVEVAKDIIAFFKAVFQGDWEEAWAKVKEVLAGFADVFLPDEFFTAVKDIFLAIKPWEWVEAAMGLFQDALMYVFTAVKDWLKDKWMFAIFGPAGILASFLPWDAIKGALGTFATNFVDTMVDVKDDVLALLGDMIQGIIDFPGEAAKSIWNWAMAGAGLAKGFFDGLRAIFSEGAGVAGDIARTIANAVIGVINTQIIDRINRMLEFSVPMPWPIPDAYINPPDIGHIGTLARGTRSFSGGMAVVGEHGPELVALPAGSAVTPAGETADALGGPISLTLNFYGPAEPEAVADATEEGLMRALRARGAIV